MEGARLWRDLRYIRLYINTNIPSANVVLVKSALVGSILCMEFLSQRERKYGACALGKKPKDLLLITNLAGMNRIQYST